VAAVWFILFFLFKSIRNTLDFDFSYDNEGNISDWGLESGCMWHGVGEHSLAWRMSWSWRLWRRCADAHVRCRPKGPLLLPPSSSLHKTSSTASPRRSPHRPRPKQVSRWFCECILDLLLDVLWISACSFTRHSLWIYLLPLSLLDMIIGHACFGLMEDITHFYISKAYIVLFYPANKEDMNYHTHFFLAYATYLCTFWNHNHQICNTQPINYRLRIPNLSKIKWSSRP
jgi:hypothetical protein